MIGQRSGSLPAMRHLVAVGGIFAVLLGSAGVVIAVTDEQASESSPTATEPDSAYPPAPEPRSEAPASRIGLFHTAADVEMWRDRAEYGPYQTEGDAFSRSPGEWDKVVADAEAVRADPEAHLWDLPEGDQCVHAQESSVETSEPRHRSRALAAAAHRDRRVGRCPAESQPRTVLRPTSRPALRGLPPALRTRQV